MKRYYRIKIETDYEDKITHQPQTKLGLFGNWKGIIPYDNKSFKIGEHEKINDFELINGGICLNDKAAAIYFINGYKVQQQKTESRVRYIRIK